MGATAQYVIGLVEELLGPAEREKRFEWCLGDKSPKTHRALALPFDAVWQDRKLIVEVDEDQHRDATPHFDKPDQLTVSGMHRGDQRRHYDQRKRDSAMKRGYTLVRLPWPRRQTRDAPHDLRHIREMLSKAGVAVERPLIQPSS